MFLLYSFLFLCVILAGLPYFLFQGLLHHKYLVSLPQRLGFFPSEFRHLPGRKIWIHAVSVGEVLAVLPLVKKIQIEFPEHLLLLSTTTITGQELARMKLRDGALSFFFPLDFAWVVRRVLRRIRPELVVIAETEIWPHFLRQCHRQRIPVLLANGRISDRSANRYKWVARMTRRVLPWFSACLMQTRSDCERIVRIGAPPKKVEACGNLKYDLDPPADLTQKKEYFQALLGIPAYRFIFIAGSTLNGEEEIVLSAFAEFRKVEPLALLILAPRHPERFSEVAAYLKLQGFNFVRRSQLTRGFTESFSKPDVILLDSIGELATLYALADLVLVGGSLVPRGGHNILEPALFHKPVLMGPYMNNFREMARLFLEQQAGFVVHDEGELKSILERLYHDPGLRRATGERGFSLLAANRGATERIIRRIRELLRATKESTTLIPDLE
jgi:3-deoxy-D-manno-octulosonic-acid transferase